MSEACSSRRALLKSAAAAGAAVITSMPASAQCDPVFAAIAAHGSAHKRIMAMDSTHAGFDAMMDEEEGPWRAFCACRPTTLDGLAAYAAHAAAYPDLPVLQGSYGPCANHLQRGRGPARPGHGSHVMTRRTSAGRPGRALATVPQHPAVQFEHQPELRALMIFPTLPPGHMTFRVEDDAFYSHLRRGELAVVDLADHWPEQGELFLIAYRDPRIECGRTFALCQMIGRTRYRRPGGGWVQQPEAGAEPATCWMARHWIPPADPRDREAALRSGQIGTSEGTFTTEHAAEKLVGLVVGVWVPPAG